MERPFESLPSLCNTAGIAFLHVKSARIIAYFATERMRHPETSSSDDSADTNQKQSASGKTSGRYIMDRH